MGKKIVEPGRPQMTTWCMRITCWIPKTTNTHSEYVIHIACRLEQWFHESIPMLRYTYIACLVNNFMILFMELLVAGHCWSDLETAAIRHRQTAAQYLKVHSLIRSVDLSAQLSSTPEVMSQFLVATERRVDGL